MRYILIAVLLFNATLLFAQHTDYAVPEKITKVIDAYPQLSPDGSKIVFQSNRMGNWIFF